ncbi:transporter [Capnocytophaga sp. ARDL2]|uniref:transporter n=1 Tax=Capnocytophaga sp. ARDL2 TaxID=3238809 RepID=UPI003558641B
MKKQFAVLFCLVGTFSQAQFTQHINSNRPSLSMGSYGVGKNVFQVETGYTMATYDHGKSSTYQLQVRTGLFFEQLEFLLQSDYTTFSNNQTTINGFRKLELGTKLIIYDAYKNYSEPINLYSWKANQRYKFKRLIPAVALYAGYHTHFPNSFSTVVPNYHWSFRLTTQQHLSRKWTLITNWNYEHLPTLQTAYMGYIATLSFAASPKVALFAEHTKKWGDYTYLLPHERELLQGGATYRWHKNLQSDVHFGIGTNSKEKFWTAGIGLSWRNQRATQWKNPYENINR